MSCFTVCSFHNTGEELSSCKTAAVTRSQWVSHGDLHGKCLNATKTHATGWMGVLQHSIRVECEMRMEADLTVWGLDGRFTRLSRSVDWAPEF
eukprot:358752-Chlamydomonas_euryale.AAC.5